VQPAYFGNESYEPTTIYTFMATGAKYCLRHKTELWCIAHPSTCIERE